MPNKSDSLSARLLISFALLCLISCGKYEDEDSVEEPEIGNWDRYIGLYQTAAITVATGKHFPSDSNKIHHVLSVDDSISGVDTKVFVWTWPWQGSDVYYIAGLVDDSPTDVLVKATDSLTPETILPIIASDADNDVLGTYGEDYFWNVTTAVDLPFASDLAEFFNSKFHPQAQPLIDLSTYTETSQCELFWINGEQQGFSTYEWKERVRGLWRLIDKNNLSQFQLELNTLKSDRCRGEYYAHIYRYILEHEQKHFAIDTKASFLDAMLVAGGSEFMSQWDYDNNICDVIKLSTIAPWGGSNEYIPKILTKYNSSIELTRSLLTHGDFENMQCSLWVTIGQLSEFDDLDLLKLALDTTLKYPHDDHYDSSHRHAFSESAENGNYGAARLLLETLPGKSDYSLGDYLMPIAKGGNADILDLVVAMGVVLDPESSNYLCNQAMLDSLIVGSQEIVSSLLSLGCTPPTENHRIEKLIKSIFTYQPASKKDYLALFRQMEDAGLRLDQLPGDSLFSINSMAIRAQASLIKTNLQHAQLPNVSRYARAVKTLLDESIPVLGDVDFKHYNKTLLMVAASSSNLPALEHILTKNPDITLKNDKNKTSLDLAYEAANELHETRSTWSVKDKIASFKEVKKHRARSLEIIRLLNGDSSHFSVYID